MYCAGFHHGAPILRFPLPNCTSFGWNFPVCELACGVTLDKPPTGGIRLRGLSPILHPLAGSAFFRFWKHYFAGWPYTWRSAHARFFAAIGVTLRLSAMFRERVRHGRAIADHSVEEAPVFLVGHWRSGTTFLHNLLSGDPRFACLSFSESAMPLDFLSKFRPAHDLMECLMPKTRGVDGVAIATDTPQEEEMALGVLGDVCFYHCFYFPRRLDYHFRRAVLLEDLRPGEREKLIENYRFLVRKVSYARGGRRVLFKNPASSARLSLLKEAFPGARFVHIVRNPYDVYPSMLALWRRLMEAFSWQDPSGIDFEEVVLSLYERTMKARLKDRERIPAADVHEVRFEDLERNPQEVVHGIYEALGMGMNEETSTALRRYLNEHADYRKNEHRLSPELRETIASRWGFAFDQWNYER